MPHFLPAFCSGCWGPVGFLEKSSSLHDRRLLLCQNCMRELWRLRQPMDFSPTGLDQPLTLYRYEGLIRDMVWRAKIKDDHGAMDLLIRYGLLPCAVAAATWADFIVAAPSSLWGRLRGRLDVAAHLAHYLSQLVRKPVALAPWHLYWRLQKNAQKASFDRLREDISYLPASWEEFFLAKWAQKLPVEPRKHSENGFRILVIDDVMTTGATIRRVGGALSKACQLRGFRPHVQALALAKSGGD
jgi:predicted amidophosphoribosyltransferase